MKTVLFLVCGLSSIASAVEGPTETTLYKSVGQDGKTVYSDRPPSEGRPSKTMKFENPPSSPISASTIAYLEQLQKTSSLLPTTAAAGEVVLYVTAWCGYCKKARAYLASKSIAYREVDIETKDGLVSYAQAGGKRGVPLLLSNGKQVLGFSAGAYDALFQTQNGSSRNSV